MVLNDRWRVATVWETGRADGVQDTRNKVHATVACPVELVGVN